MTQQSLIIGLRAETGIHAGSGESDGIVDLPIMRERHSGWPVIYGSAVKGALRAAADQRFSKEEAEVLLAIFGPDTSSASDHAGSMMVSDARLIALPVRSLTSQYRLVTCPDLIQRMCRDIKRLAVTGYEGLSIPKPANDVVLTAGDEAQEQLFLEEFAYRRETADFESLALLLAALSDLSVDDIKEKLAVVSNDSFTHLCSSAVPVLPHIALDSKTKTVIDGALFHEEYLPPDSLLYVMLNTVSSRRASMQASAEELMKVIEDEFLDAFPYLQVGGNETTGMGWCKLSGLKGA